MPIAQYRRFAEKKGKKGEPAINIMDPDSVEAELEGTPQRCMYMPDVAMSAPYRSWDLSSSFRKTIAFK
jgi:hypothetical protein